jgi:hypothetical protein
MRDAGSRQRLLIAKDEALGLHINKRHRDLGAQSLDPADLALDTTLSNRRFGCSQGI